MSDAPSLRGSVRSLNGHLNLPGMCRAIVGEGDGVIVLYAKTRRDEKMFREDFPEWGGWPVRVTYMGKIAPIGKV